MPKRTRNDYGSTAKGVGKHGGAKRVPGDRLKCEPNPKATMNASYLGNMKVEKIKSPKKSY